MGRISRWPWPEASSMFGASMRSELADNSREAEQGRKRASLTGLQFLDSRRAKWKLATGSWSHSGCGISGLAGFLMALVVVWVTGTGFAAPAVSKAAPSYENLQTWLDACRRLPANRVLSGRFPKTDVLPLSKFDPLAALLDGFFDTCRTGALGQPTGWVGERPRLEQFFDPTRGYFLQPPIPFQPFAQKLALPEGAEVVLRGDLHGDIQSLNAMLDWLNREHYLSNFTVSRPNTYLIFLGDYTDRGAYGVEVIYTLMRLKLANPDRVFMVRGNHEDVSLAARYGFLAEGRAKYGNAFDAVKVCRFYDFLPVVLYLGCGANFVQCNHGGLEPGYSPVALLEAPGETRWQLLGQIKQRRLLQKSTPGFDALDGRAQAVAQRYWQDFQPASPTTPNLLGFMWNDFTQVSGQPQFELDPDRGFVYGDRATRFYLDRVSSPAARVRAVFRAHQHAAQLNPMMRRLVASRGIYRHWQETDSLAQLEAPVVSLRDRLDAAAERAIPDGSVWTFNVGPDSVYGAACNFDFDTFGILTVHADFKDWRLRVVNVSNPALSK